MRTKPGKDTRCKKQLGSEARSLLCLVRWKYFRSNATLLCKLLLFLLCYSQSSDLNLLRLLLLGLCRQFNPEYSVLHAGLDVLGL